jgi:hypothetical protein
LTALLPDDLQGFFSETEPESDKDIAVVSVHTVTGSPPPMTVLPLDVVDTSMTKPESDEEPQIAAASMGTVSRMPPIKRPLPLNNPITSETKLESDEDPHIAPVSLQFSSSSHQYDHQSLIANIQSRLLSNMQSSREFDTFCSTLSLVCLCHVMVACY